MHLLALFILYGVITFAYSGNIGSLYFLQYNKIRKGRNLKCIN